MEKIRGRLSRPLVKDGIRTIFLAGRIDSTNAEKARSETEDMIKAYPGAEPVIDAGDLSYISSAGIRVLLHIESVSGVEKLTIQNVTRDVYGKASVRIDILSGKAGYRFNMELRYLQACYMGFKLPDYL